MIRPYLIFFAQIKGFKIYFWGLKNNKTATDDTKQNILFTLQR